MTGSRWRRSISEIIGVLTPTQSNLVYLAYGVAILALPFVILVGLIVGRHWKLLGAYAAAGVARRARAVDQRQRHRGAAMAFRPGRAARHPPVAVPRRPPLDRDARRGAHGVRALAARAVAPVVVGAAAGVRADPPRRQRRGARPAHCWAWRWAGSSARWWCWSSAPPPWRCRSTGRCGRWPDADSWYRTDGGATGRTRTAGAVGDVATRTARPRSSSCTARINAAAARCASSGESSGCAAAKPRRCRPRCAAPSSIAR